MLAVGATVLDTALGSAASQSGALQQFVEMLKFLFANGAEEESSPYHNEALALMSKTVCSALLLLEICKGDIEYLNTLQ